MRHRGARRGADLHHGDNRYHRRAYHYYHASQHNRCTDDHAHDHTLSVIAQASPDRSTPITEVWVGTIPTCH